MREAANGRRACTQELSAQFSASRCPARVPRCRPLVCCSLLPRINIRPYCEQGDHTRDKRNEYADALFELPTKRPKSDSCRSLFSGRRQPCAKTLNTPKDGESWVTSCATVVAFTFRPADGRTPSKCGTRSTVGSCASDVPRYEAGERLVDGRTISAEADAHVHRDINNGWQLRTDHFLITTNHTLEAAADLAARLERLHQVWRQLFAAFYLREHEVRGGRRRPPASATSETFRVYYHRTKDEYVALQRRRQPRH